MISHTSSSEEWDVSGRLWRFGTCKFDESGHELRISGLGVDLESNQSVSAKAPFQTLASPTPWSENEAKKPLFRPQRLHRIH